MNKLLAQVPAAQRAAARAQLDDASGYTFYLKHTSLGFYFAVGAFVLLGVGALIGPMRRRP